ncbi:hypothetical protein OV203_44940 [Nannocystis sp. ILAH1]|uniref:hypothetical protein n=1 Tax=Nannocystis sp. ILAH1 TaxID=2996789 RepID=UPI002270CE61|nr:hypothetical protein [Nannocystis sp. ILAH1]MCY0994356.1 hypothetical protein [Nannocystis sp. ILAH1]
MMRRSVRFAVESFLGLAVVAGCGDSSGPSPATATGITGATSLTGQAPGTTTGPDAPGGDSTAVPTTTTGDPSAGTTTDNTPPDGLPKLDLGEQPEGTTGENDPAGWPAARRSTSCSWSTTRARWPTSRPT